MGLAAFGARSEQPIFLFSFFGGGDMYYVII
jgi:hypothetical protein